MGYINSLLSKVTYLHVDDETVKAKNIIESREFS